MAVHPAWDVGSRYQLALCEYNKVFWGESMGGESVRHLKTTFLLNEQRIDLARTVRKTVSL